MHTQAMEGICTAGMLEEGEVVRQVRTRTRMLHTQTHRSIDALHVYALDYTQRELCAHRCTHLHTQVMMKGVCTTGTLKEGEVYMAGSNTYVHPTHTHANTQEF